jgi:hypothetical protein
VGPHPFQSTECTTEAIASDFHGIHPRIRLDLQANRNGWQLRVDVAPFIRASDPSSPIHQLQIVCEAHRQARLLIRRFVTEGKQRRRANANLTFTFARCKPTRS